jgi:ABC-type tungstate transport system permease subunit
MFPAVAQAQSADFTVSATREIRDTGFLQHLLPRFSLKHGVRITQVDESGDVVIGGKVCRFLLGWTRSGL